MQPSTRFPKKMLIFGVGGINFFYPFIHSGFHEFGRREEKWSNNKQKKFGFISEACRLTHRGGIPTAHLPPRIGFRSSGMNLFARNKREKECKHAHLNARLPPLSKPYRAACAQQADFRRRVGVKWSKTHFHLICVFLWQIRQPASCFSFSNDDIIFVVRARPLPSLRHKRERRSAVSMGREREQRA